MGKRNPRKARDRSQCRCGGVGSGQRAVGGAAGGGQQAGSKQSAAGSRQQTAGSGQRAAGSGQQAAAGREQRAEGSEQQASECIAKIEVRFVHPEPETQSLSCPLRPATDSLPVCSVHQTQNPSFFTLTSLCLSQFRRLCGFFTSVFQYSPFLSLFKKH